MIGVVVTVAVAVGVCVDVVVIVTIGGCYCQGSVDDALVLWHRCCFFAAATTLIVANCYHPYCG